MQNGQSTSDTDFALHLAIADATNNPRFREFLAMLGSSMIPRASLQSDVDEEEAITYLRQIHEEHSEIVNAISDGRVEAARAAMDKHLKGSQRRYRSLLQPK
jgi:DNA-binding FadR family transcriptional regulator